MFTKLSKIVAKTFHSHAISQRRNGRILRRAALRLEELQERIVLTGTWTSVNEPIPQINSANSGAMLLLTDGSVMVQGGGITAAWHRLTPDATGGYANGSWSDLAFMNSPRLFYASQVLRDGRVFVLGGEYTEFGQPQTDVNTGEIFDPTAGPVSDQFHPELGPTGSWTSIVNPLPETHAGDAISALLPDGRVLVGSMDTPNTHVFDPSNGTWTNGPTRLHGDTSSEEGWVQVGDGMILSYAIQGSKPDAGQLYLPATATSPAQWVDAGQVPGSLTTNGGGNIVPEIGPGVRLNDGRIFWIGANGHTAFFNAGNSTWTAGPNVPHGLGGFDSCAAVEPNGKVLFAAGKPDASFPAPTELFEFDPSTNAIIPVDMTNGPDLSTVKEFTVRMLVLPTGQILVGDSSSDKLFLYKPDSPPNPAFAPQITGVNDNGDGSFTLTGTRLSGVSEGATYGDDGQMATNYPIVRIVDATGSVHFARTTFWNTNVVGSTAPEGVRFTVPAGVGNVYSLSVITNGIASKQVLMVNGAPGVVDDTISLDTVKIFFARTVVTVDGNTTGWAGVSAVFVHSGEGDDTVNVRRTLAGVPVTVESTYDHATINIGHDGTVQDIQGDVTLANSLMLSTDDVTIDDSADTQGRNATLTSFTTPDGRPWGQLTGLAPGHVNYRYVDTGNVTINTGSGHDTITVGATGPNGITTLLGDAVANVTVGGAVTGNIRGTLALENPTSFFVLTVDDHADTVAKTVTLGTFTPDGDTAWESITGLAAAAITYRASDVSGPVVLDGGSGGNTFNVQGTAGPVVINGGSGNDTFTVTSFIGLASVVTLDGGGMDTLIGPSVASNWTISGAGSGTLGNGVVFNAMRNLVGGAADDTFKFVGGSIPGRISGGFGTNALDYAALAGPVAVNLQTRAASLVNGGFNAIDSFIGSAAASNMLIGPNADTVWRITSTNSGTVGTANFARFQKLRGGTCVDVFRFTGAGNVSGGINGGMAPLHTGNWLDYSGLTTSVVVNLATGSATAVAGGTPSKVKNIQDVHGGDGGDTLTGNARNILIGGAGADTLKGGTGPSLLIGGNSADNVTGGSGRDILIGDATAFDQLTSAHELALMSILAEWQSADSYATRFHDINTGGGTGLNGRAKLNFGTTVKDDGATDTVTAAASRQPLDWFFLGAGDTANNLQHGEHVNNT